MPPPPDELDGLAWRNQARRALLAPGAPARPPIDKRTCSAIAWYARLGTSAAFRKAS